MSQPGFCVPLKTVSSRERLCSRFCLAAAIFAFVPAGCSEQDMVTQPKLKTLQPSSFFADGQSARQVEPGTIAIGQLRINPAFDTGEAEGKLVSYIPLAGFTPESKAEDREARKTVLARGRQRFNIFCAPCHSQTGEGNGMIVQRGFSPPPSLHLPRLRDVPPGHLFRVITNGYGAMYSYASRISPADRWAIAAYIKALQLSQNAQVADLPESQRSGLEAEGAAK